MTLDLSGALQETAGGTLLLLEVTPGAKGAHFPAGYDPWRRRIGIRVRAPPEGGRANREVCALVATWFGLGRSAVSVAAGQTSRQKTVALDGVDPSEVLLRLEGAVA